MHTARSSSRRGGGVWLSACWDRSPLGVGLETPQVWTWRHPPTGVGLENPLARSPSTSPLGCGPGDPPGQIPLNFPPGCGPGDPPSQIPLNFPPGCGPGNLQGMLGYHPLPVNRITDTYMCKNITLPNFVAGGNNGSLSLSLSLCSVYIT